MDIINRSLTTPFTTKDGSEIRELLAYRNSSIRNQSLAEATIAVGTATQEHYHPKSEEIYYISYGTSHNLRFVQVLCTNGENVVESRHEQVQEPAA